LIVGIEVVRRRHRIAGAGSFEVMASLTSHLQHGIAEVAWLWVRQTDPPPQRARQVVRFALVSGYAIARAVLL
jgi:hypothetical protein